MVIVRWRSSNEPIQFGMAAVLLVLVTLVTTSAVELVVDPGDGNGKFQNESILAGGVAGAATIAAWIYHKRIVCGVID